MKRQETVSRRALLRAGAAAGFSILPSRVLGFQGATPPSEKLNVAFIGLGTYGARGLSELAMHNIVALCDVDWRTRNQIGGTSPIASEVAAQHPGVRRFDDWRVMLEEMDRQIDGVVIASADHTHAVAAITAMKMGKHVYCEKPLAHSIHDVRAMVAAADKYKVATQFGTQGHASDDCRSMVEWIRDGAIGDVKEVHLFQIGRAPGYYFQTLDEQRQALGQVADGREPPPEVKWDLWLGPAPFRAFHPMYVPKRWRGWIDFGTGILGDHGPHFLDPVAWALDLEMPETIEAETSPEWDPGRDTQVWPFESTVRYTFPARGERPPVALTWHGFRKPPTPPGWDPNEPLPDGGGIVLGSKGTIVFGPMYSGTPGKPVPGLLRLLPDELDREYRRPAKSLPRPASNWLEWVEAAKAGKQPSADFHYGRILTEVPLLGDIAIRQKGQILRYDAKAGRFTNSDPANEMFSRPSREGWELPS